jgi:hypothetical protein
VNQPPRDEYQRRLDARRAAATQEARRDRSIANARLAVFLIAVALGATFVVRRGAFARPFALALAAIAVLFIVLVVIHDRVIRLRKRAERAVAFYEGGLARIDDVWAGTGDPGGEFADTHHPYTDDLDVFGPGSLFELLCRARTGWGRAKLAGWLRSPADVRTARARQRAVAEMSGLLDLREALALTGERVAALSPDAMLRWTAEPGETVPAWARALAYALPAFAAAGLAGWIFSGIGMIPFFTAVFLEFAFVWGMRRRIARIVSGADKPSADLGLLAGILALFERERFESDHLRAIVARVETGGVPASRRIAELARIADRLDWARNAIAAPIAFVLLWESHHAFAIQRWRARFGPHVTAWCDAVAEIEAIASLACQAFERPVDPFPEFTDEQDAAEAVRKRPAPVYEADGLGHPLIPGARCVRNDVRLTGGLKMLVVSGSNMSGKSTLLRAVGTNAILAFAGAPVRARRLRLSPLATGASIRRNDSLQEGVSRFYAEITRLRRLLEIAEGPIPLLFLIDEMLNGTNSHDRRIGSEGVLTSLVERDAIGLVTTHDLALAQIADRMTPRAANVHFEDFIDQGRIAFDYRLRPGVVEKSNALALMRAVGLDVGVTGPETETSGGPS